MNSTRIASSLIKNCYLYNVHTYSDKIVYYMYSCLKLIFIHRNTNTHVFRSLFNMENIKFFLFSCDEHSKCVASKIYKEHYVTAIEFNFIQTKFPEYNNV